MLKRSSSLSSLLVEVKVKKEKVIEKGNFLWSGGGNEHEEKINVAVLLLLLVCMLYYLLSFAAAAAVNMFLFVLCRLYVPLFLFVLKKLTSSPAIVHWICTSLGRLTLSAWYFVSEPASHHAFPNLVQEIKKGKETKTEDKLLQSCVPRRWVAALLLQVHLYVSWFRVGKNVRTRRTHEMKCYVPPPSPNIQTAVLGNIELGMVMWVITCTWMFFSFSYGKLLVSPLVFPLFL